MRETYVYRNYIETTSLCLITSLVGKLKYCSAWKDESGSEVHLTPWPV